MGLSLAEERALAEAKGILADVAHHNPHTLQDACDTVERLTSDPDTIKTITFVRSTIAPEAS